jgi:homoaconitate hydratase
MQFLMHSKIEILLKILNLHQSHPSLAMLSRLRGTAAVFRRPYATASQPQTLIEKIVQKYAVGFGDGRKVKSGDYVMVSPEHV